MLLIISGTMPLPPPSAPPPPPPPIEDIPQRGITMPTQLCKHQQMLQQQRSLQFGPQVRGNYSDVENMRRGLQQSENLDNVRRQYSDSDCVCPHTRGPNHYSDGDACDYEPHILVQTPNGNVFIPQSQGEWRFIYKNATWFKWLYLINILLKLTLLGISEGFRNDMSNS